jgi:hypothetical protein
MSDAVSSVREKRCDMSAAARRHPFTQHYVGEVPIQQLFESSKAKSMNACKKRQIMHRCVVVCYRCSTGVISSASAP